MSEKPSIVFVDQLPDLMTREDYEVAHRQKTVRIRLTVTDAGLEIIGDSSYPQLLDELLAALDPKVVEMVLCG